MKTEIKIHGNGDKEIVLSAENDSEKDVLHIISTIKEFSHYAIVPERISCAPSGLEKRPDKVHFKPEEDKRTMAGVEAWLDQQPGEFLNEMNALVPMTSSTTARIGDNEPYQVVNLQEVTTERRIMNVLARALEDWTRLKSRREKRAEKLTKKLQKTNRK